MKKTTGWKPFAIIAMLAMVTACNGSDNEMLDPEPVDPSDPIDEPDNPTGPIDLTGMVFRVGSGEMDYGKDITIAADGSVYTAGYFGGTVDFDPGETELSLTSNGFVDIYLAKYTPALELEWVVNFGGPGADMPHTVAVMPDGDILLTGYFGGTASFDPSGQAAPLDANGLRDVFVARYSPDGIHRWSFGFGGPDPDNDCPLENNRCDEGMDLAVNSQGDLYVTGRFNGTVDMDPGPEQALLVAQGDSDAFVAKYSADGGHLWSFALGAEGSDTGMSLDITPDDGIALTGTFYNTIDVDPGPDTVALSATAMDTYIARYGPDMTLIDAFAITGPAIVMSAPGSLAVDDAGDVYVTGRFTGTATLDSRAGSAATQLASGGDFDIFVARYGSSGDLAWGFGLGAEGLDGGHRIDIDSAGGVYLAGWFRNTMDVDPGAGETLLSAHSSTGASDVLLAKYASDGSLAWAHGLGGETEGPEEWSIAAGLAIGPDDSVAITGRMFYSVDFDPGDGVYTLTSAGGPDAYVARFDANGGFEL